MNHKEIEDITFQQLKVLSSKVSPTHGKGTTWAALGLPSLFEVRV